MVSCNKYSPSPLAYEPEVGVIPPVETRVLLIWVRPSNNYSKTLSKRRPVSDTRPGTFHVISWGTRCHFSADTIWQCFARGPTEPRPKWRLDRVRPSEWNVPLNRIVILCRRENNWLPKSKIKTCYLNFMFGWNIWSCIEFYQITTHQQFVLTLDVFVVIS